VRAAPPTTTGDGGSDGSTRGRRLYNGGAVSTRQQPTVYSDPGPAWLFGSPPRLAALGALVAAATLLLLYVYRRRRFILEWTVGWALLAASLLLWSVEAGQRLVGLALLGLSHFLTIGAAILFVIGTDTYRSGEPSRPRLLWMPVPFLLWFVLAPLALGPGSVVVPGYLVAAGVLAVAGVSSLLVLRHARLLGPGLLGTMLMVLAGSYGVLAARLVGAPGEPVVAAELLAGHALLYLLAAMAMHLVVFEDMTYELRVTNRQLEAAQADLRQMAITDALTGCHNRRFFDEVIRRELQRHRRYETPLTLMFIDVDRFKQVNDAFGHEAGDELLRYVAEFLRRHIREADYVFRWGGDEFLVLISCSLGEALKKAARLKTAFRDLVADMPLPDGVGLSVGCAAVPEEADDIAPLIREADQRMYEDKAAGLRARRWPASV
jgi:diguanylate cyclase (GGDEF)-like protein